MKEFKIQQEHLEKSRKTYKTILVTLAIALLLFEICIFWEWLSIPDYRYIAMIVIPLFAIYLGFSGWRSYKKQQTRLQDYRIRIDEEQITVRRTETFSHSISFMEIKEIIKGPKGNFIVVGEGKGNCILISKKLENFGEVEEMLQKFGEIKYRKNNNKVYVRLAALISIFILVIIFLLSENKWVTIIAGPICIAGALTIIYYTIIGKSASATEKRKAWPLVLLVVLIAFLMYARLSA